jgi:polar amino acid transport system ATP-binding protein
MLKMEQVHKSFGKLDVLRGIDLDVKKGEVVVIIGRSGSGKSTLLYCINHLEPIEKGRIWVDGELVGGKAKEVQKLRQKVGMVFQDFNLFPHLDALGNVTLALKVVKKIAREEAERLGTEVLKKVGLGDKLNSFPDKLSGGQQQRVAIARSLAMNPKLMLFDEVTSALDPELVGEVLNVIEELAKTGMTMVLVTHEMGFAKKVANMVIFMHEGLIIESGSPNKIFNNPESPQLKLFVDAIL